MKVKKNIWLVAGIALLVSVLACGPIDNLVDRAVDEASEAVVEQIEEQTGEELPDRDSLQATADAALEDLDELEDMIPGGFGATGESGFTVMEGGAVLLEDENSITYTVDGVTVADVVTFYRNEFTGQGLTEREITTVVQESVASLVFDGDTSGLATVVQATDIGGSVSVALTRQDT